MANSVKFNVGFNVDKSALTEIKSSLTEIQKLANSSNTGSGIDDNLRQAATAARQLENILNQSWNSKLQQFDLSKFNQSVKESYGSVSDLKTQLELGGAIGGTAFNKLSSNILNTNLQLKDSHKLLDDFATTFKNTVRYGISSSIFNNLSNSLRQAFDYTKRFRNC